MLNKTKPVIAISSCLLGELVRYNKGHCKESWIVDELSKFVELYPVCPEVEMGLGTPREEIHLYYDKGDEKNIKLKSKHTNIELTQKAQETYKAMGTKLSEKKIDGFILTKKSPSCGIDRVKTILKGNPQTIKQSVGLFAKYVMETYQSVPIIDSGRLHDKNYRENFIKSVFAHYKFTQLEQSLSEFQGYHKSYKYIIMDHSPFNLKELGNIVANTTADNYQESSAKYYDLFFQTLKVHTNNKLRFNTLQHIMGYFKNHLQKDEKALLLDLLEDCKQGSYNHAVALKHLELLTNKYNISYLQDQVYFCPYPKELKLLKEI